MAAMRGLHLAPHKNVPLYGWEWRGDNPDESAGTMSVETSIRVVIAEGDPTLADRIRATLRLYWPGARFAIVHSGPEAVEAVSQERVDLFILDPRLPDRPVHGGRRVRSGLSRVPTVVLVASEDEARRDDVAGGRDTEYVVTPLGPLELLARTREVLHQAREEP